MLDKNEDAKYLEIHIKPSGILVSEAIEKLKLFQEKHGDIDVSYSFSGIVGFEKIVESLKEMHSTPIEK